MILAVSLKLTLKCKKKKISVGCHVMLKMLEVIGHQWYPYSVYIEKKKEKTLYGKVQWNAKTCCVNITKDFTF